MYKTPTLWGYVLARKMWQNQNYLLRRKVLKMRRSEKGKKTDKILNCFVCVIVLSAKISWFSGFSSTPQSNFLELQKFFKHSVVILRLYKRCYFQIIAETDTLLPKSPPLPKVDRILKLLSNTRKYFNQLLLTICSGHSKEIHSTDKRRKSM